MRGTCSPRSCWKTASSSLRPGEFVYWPDWQHDGYRYDPRRVGVPGRPPTPGHGTYPNGDYSLHLTHDLRPASGIPGSRP
ncbi:DUF2716 domain-containing protein [Streptomyces sp. NBC_00667]|uniref:DUF2716 domain-containing protein n=1 Tax=unclassified Streptomyces TaxID=2593676 RepID=UPI003FA7B1E6